jgi:Flp pilus assembly protein TadD
MTRSPMRLARIIAPRLLVSTALAALLATGLTGCKTLGQETTGSIAAPTPPHTQAEWRGAIGGLEAAYRAHPEDPSAAIQYAQALSATDQTAQAAAVLEQASIRHPNDKALLGAYGRALAEVGKYNQALAVLSRAHSPDMPDWRILSAQGAVLDQLGRHEEARRYYATALKISPDESSVLSNLGLSYALSKNLPMAEETLRKAVAQPSADPRARQNLALVVGLEGRFDEAEAIARADLPPDEAAANIAFLREMLSQHNDQAKKPAHRASVPRKPAPRKPALRS